MLKIIPEPLQVVTNIHYAHCLKSEEWEKLDGAFQTNQSINVGTKLAAFLSPDKRRTMTSFIRPTF